MKRTLLIFFLPLAALAFVFREVLFFGRFFFNNDVLLANLPFLLYHGEGGPLIVQHMLSGFPLVVTVNASWLYPVNTFLFSHMRPTDAYLLMDIGAIVLSYIFGYLYSRKIGLSTTAAALSGMTYIFAGQLMLWGASIVMTAYYFLLPASLYLFEVSFGKRLIVRLGLLVLSGLLLGSGWLSSQVQFLVYIHVFYFVYVAARLLWRNRQEWGSALLSVVVPYVVSFAVGLPMILTVLSFQSQTLRSSGVSLAQYAGLGFMPWDFIHYLLPFWNVSFFPVALPELYIGILPLLLIVIGVFSYRKEWNGYFVFYMCVLLFCLLASIKYSPLAIALHYLPLWNSFREASRMMFIGGFASAMLAGLTLDLLLARWNLIDLARLRVVRYTRMLLLYFYLPVLVLFSAVRFFFFDVIKARLDQYFLSHVYASTTGLPQEHYLAVIDSYLHQALDQFSFFDAQAVVLLLFGAAALALFIYHKKFTPQQFGFAVVGVAALNFACVYGMYYPSIATASIFSVPPTLEMITAQEQGSSTPYRIYSLFPAMTIYNAGVACTINSDEKVALQNAFLQPNSSLIFGVDSVDGYENFMPAIMSPMLNYIGSESTGESDPLFLSQLSLDEKLQLVESRANVLRVMNVKYVISGTPLEPSVFQTLGKWQIGRCKTPVYLYKLPGTWPRYFTSSTMGTSSTLESLSASKLSNATEVIPALSYDSLKFSAVTCTTNCILFVGNTYLSGWHAYVDGGAVPIMRANFAYMAVPLEPGKHDVVLRYDTPL